LRDELKTKFMRARLAAILQCELRESGRSHIQSDVAIVPEMGYLVSLHSHEDVTIRLIEE
jgi:hypothetical protein